VPLYARPTGVRTDDAMMTSLISVLGSVFSPASYVVKRKGRQKHNVF
jgi:hypothetical protein